MISRARGVAWTLLAGALVNLRPWARDRRIAFGALAAAAIAAAIFVRTLGDRTPVATGSDAVPGEAHAAQRAAGVEKVGTRVHTSGASTPAPGNAIAGEDHVTALRRGLASPDEAVRIAAVEAAVSATAVETIGDLRAFELARDPEAAPTVIHALALLGASADGATRDDAAKTLAGWLRDELKRDGPDVPGNISNIVEALGDVGGHDAVDALTTALDRTELALHVETLAVTKLGELGDARARAPVERFARRIAALPPAEGIDEELRVEALAAARTTLSKI